MMLSLHVGARRNAAIFGRRCLATRDKLDISTLKTCSTAFAKWPSVIGHVHRCSFSSAHVLENKKTFAPSAPDKLVLPAATTKGKSIRTPRKHTESVAIHNTNSKLDRALDIPKRQCSSVSRSHTADKADELWPSMRYWMGRPTVANTTSEERLFREIECAASTNEILELIQTPQFVLYARDNTDVLRHALKYITFKHYMHLEQHASCSTFLIPNILKAQWQLSTFKILEQNMTPILEHANFAPFLCLIEELLSDIPGHHTSEIAWLLTHLGVAPHSQLVAALFSKGIAELQRNPDLRSILFLRNITYNYDLQAMLLRELHRVVGHHDFSFDRSSIEDTRVVLTAISRVNHKAHTLTFLKSDLIEQLLNSTALCTNAHDIALVAGALPSASYRLTPQEKNQIQHSLSGFIRRVQQHDSGAFMPHEISEINRKVYSVSCGRN